MKPGELINAFEAAVEKTDFAHLDEIFHADIIYHDFVYGEIRGRRNLADFFQKWVRDGRDYVWRFYDAVTDDNRAYASWYFSYTRLRGLPPRYKQSGVRLEILGMSRFAFAEDRISEYREMLNPATALRDMGLPEDLAARQLKRHAERDKKEITALKTRLGIS